MYCRTSKAKLAVPSIDFRAVIKFQSKEGVEPGDIKQRLDPLYGIGRSCFVGVQRLLKMIRAKVACSSNNTRKFRFSRTSYFKRFVLWKQHMQSYSKPASYAEEKWVKMCGFWMITSLDPIHFQWSIMNVLWHFC